MNKLLKLEKGPNGKNWGSHCAVIGDSHPPQQLYILMMVLQQSGCLQESVKTIGKSSGRMQIYTGWCVPLPSHSNIQF